MAESKKVSSKFTDKHEEKLYKLSEFLTMQTALNASINQNLTDISRIIKEIHDKLDMNLLHSVEKFTKLEGKDALYEERFKQLKDQSKSRDTNWWMIFSAIITVACTVLGAILVSK